MTTKRTVIWPALATVALATVLIVGAHAARGKDEPQSTRQPPHPYCCSSECCDLYKECQKDPNNCNGWYICHGANNDCVCSGAACRGMPPALSKGAQAEVASLTDPVAKAAATSSECLWQCLSVFRSCLHQCTTSCRQCTTAYGACQTSCARTAPTERTSK